MGTSKGYIPPTTIHWSQAKRTVTSYINSGDDDSRASAASKFATAMRHDSTSSKNFAKASGDILAFANAVSSGGLKSALNEFGRNDLVDKSADIVFDELLEGFTNYGSTTEDYLSAEAIASALRELNISDMEQLKDIQASILLKEMLIEYIKFSFAFRYEEKIRMNKSPAETEKLLNEMNKYISNELHSKLDLGRLSTVNFNKMNASVIVEKALEDAYHVFEIFYGGHNK